MDLLLPEEDAVELTYGQRITALLGPFLMETGTRIEISQVTLKLVPILIREALGHRRSTADFRSRLEKIKGLVQQILSDTQGVPSGFRAIETQLKTLIIEEQSRFQKIKSDYDEHLEAYSQRQFTRYGWGDVEKRRSPATHAEIMFLDDFIEGIRKGRRGVLVDGIMEQSSSPPKLIFVSKPMCENCEPAIVRAYRGAGSLSVTVVSDKKPTEAELERDNPSSNVFKVNLPNDKKD